MISVIVRPYTILRDYLPTLRDGSTVRLELGPGGTAQDVLAKLGIPEEKVMLVAINGQPAQLTDPLADGDHLVLLPPVSGG
ncbi:MAG: MoaD/ThiS family protein [Chloroflexi bacterium]|nr:MoaD/ThiS family protein [Chloroflexota bacterium]